MGQQEVYDFLMKNPDHWYTSKQISEQLIVSIGSVTMSLKKLRKTNIIKYRNTGKRNTFQYMVQSEPAKLAERTTPMAEHMNEPIKVKVKIKPKIVHQHTYLGGQTFYGVIRGKDESDASERRRDEDAVVLMGGDDDSEPSEPTPRKTIAKKRVVKRVAKKKAVARKKVTVRAKPKAKPRKILKSARKPMKAKKRVLSKRR